MEYETFENQDLTVSSIYPQETEEIENKRKIMETQLFDIFNKYR